MTTKIAGRLLLAVALSGVVLAGCVPAGTTGTASGGCDPSGMPGINGCDSPAEPQADPVSGTSDTGSGEVSCDSSGFGPLSGCGNSQDDDPAQDGDRGFVPDPGVSADWMAKTARHEAGHKAVADEYGWHVQSVQINPDGSGITNVSGLRWKDPQQRLALYYAGGAAAGGLYVSSENEKDDLDYVDDILSRYPDDEAARMDDAAQAEADRIVAKRSAEIDRDTADLLEDGDLS